MVYRPHREPEPPKAAGSLKEADCEVAQSDGSDEQNAEN